MNLQPLYDVKTRLEQAAIAGTGLLAEDFRLQRAAEALKPLAAASPVFARIDAGLTALLSAPAEARAGLLLDVLALADAVAYTQAKTGLDGDLTPLPTGGGRYYRLSYGQLRPLLTALTSTGGGRAEVVQSRWESCAAYFEDYRVLPALVAGLGDSYGDMAQLCAKILKKMGASALPLLKENFDPAGNKSMARRVEVVAAIAGSSAVPWLLEVLPEAKNDVRAAVITALGTDPANTALLLELAKSERGKSRDAALTALAWQDGDAVAAFWGTELQKNSGSVRFLRDTDTAWASGLVASGLRARLEGMLARGGRVPAQEQTELSDWCQAVGKKDSPAMLDFWRWADGHMEEFDGFTNEKGNPVFIGVRLTDTLRDCLGHTGPGPLRDFCLTLFDGHPAMTRYLRLSFQAALLSRPAAEVFEKYSPYLLTEEPDGDAGRARTLNIVLLKALGDTMWNRNQGRYITFDGLPTAQPLDKRWLERLTRAVCTDVQKHSTSPFPYYWEDVCEFDMTLMRLADPADEENRKLLIPYLRRRLDETNQPYTYSRWLFQLGGSPRGVLGGAMVVNPKPNRVGAVWGLMNEAAQALPADEVAALLGEILDSKCIYKDARAHLEPVIPWTIRQLDEGKSFPSLDEWTKYRGP